MNITLEELSRLPRPVLRRSVNGEEPPFYSPPVLRRCPFHVPRENSDSGIVDVPTVFADFMELAQFAQLVRTRAWENDPRVDLQHAYDHISDKDFEEYLADRSMSL
jgi:hypothetical protein